MQLEYPNGDLADSDYATPTDLDIKFQAIKTVLNGGLDEDNIGEGAQIDPDRIGEGGALTADDTTSTGAEGKVPVYGANGELSVKKLVFKTGIA